MASERWLEHATALRALAAALAVEGSEADDLVQEAWLRAARRGDAEQPRAWWSAVFRNLVRDSARRRGRRNASEHVAARDERLPSEVEMLERLEIAQRVAAEVAKLDEPYRTAIHLRYFEGLSAEQIARRSNTPLETIRARLRRGLQQLRERMDRSCGGDRSVWSTALSAIALRGESPVAAASATSLVSIGGIAMSVKLASSVAAAIVLGVGAYFLWPKSEAASPHGSAPIVEAAAPSLPPTTTEAAPPRVDPTPVRAEATPPATPEPAAQAADDGTFEVRGTVVIVDESNVEHTSESGTFSAVYGVTESDVHRGEVKFEKGAWSLRIPKGSFLGCGKLMVRGREALLPRDKPMRPGADPIELRGRWLARGRLHVIDAVTKQDLHEVELRYAQGWRANPEWTHPGDFTEMTAVHFATSPFDLPERMQLTPYWVHANGYAWTRVDFDHRIGGEQTVAMLQPAAVNVSVAGGSLPAGANVRLYSSKTISYSFEAAVSVHAASTGSTRIDDLAPAHYFACVEVGEDEARQRLGETEVDLAANQVTDVTVTIDASKLDVPMVHLYGTLVLPEGVDAASTQLTLWREGAEAARILLKASEMPAVGGDEHVRSWDAGSVRTGTWGAAVRPAMFRQAIVAETPGELRVEIKLPKVFAVSVHVIDADTREPLAPDRIMWSDAAVEGLRQGFNVPVFSLGTKGAYRFEAPSGVVRFMCDLKGYVPYSQEIDLHADVPELQAELHRSAGVHIQVLEGEARLRVGFEFFDGVRVTRPGERRRLGIPAGGTEFELTRLLDPGKYEIQFPALDGYQPIDPVTVDVAAGQLVDVDVHVVRKP